MEKGTSQPIFYGPSGTGKTTVAEIIAKGQTELQEAQYLFAGISDIKEIISELDTMMTPNCCCIWMIQYFNKTAQNRCWNILKAGIYA